MSKSICTNDVDRSEVQARVANINQLFTDRIIGVELNALTGVWAKLAILMAVNSDNLADYEEMVRCLAQKLKKQDDSNIFNGSTCNTITDWFVKNKIPSHFWE